MTAVPLGNVRPSIPGFTVSSLSVREPRVEWLPVDVGSNPIRWGDPVKQVAGGGITRATPADTTLLGFAAAVNGQNLPTSIPWVNAGGTDTAGRNFVPVYVGDGDTVFTGQCSGTTAQSLVMQTMDLQYQAISPTVTVAVIGATGAETDSYQVTAVTATGEAAAPTQVQVTTGNATKTAANRNDVTIPYTPFANKYEIYRKIAAGAFVHIGEIAAVQPSVGNAAPNTVFSDTGQTAIDSALPPTVNNSGYLINNAANAVGIIQCLRLETRGPGNTILAPGQGVLYGKIIFNVFQTKTQYGMVAGS